MAVEREVREELNSEVTDLQLVGTLENIFTYNGAPGHEIVLIYDGKFTDNLLYAQDILQGVESNGQSFEARWRGSESFTSTTPLHPHGLPELLQSLEATHAP